jgi:uncharacterized protein
MFVEAAGITALAAIYGAFVEPRRIQRVRLKLRLPNLPPALDGFRAHIAADLHSTQFGAMEQRVRSILLADPVDAVFTLGDYVWRNSDPEYALKVFDGLPSRLGVFGILGNNEYKRRVDTQAVLEALRGRIRMLVNESVMLEHDGAEFQLIGVNDPYEGRACLSEAIAQCSPPGKPYRILLSHSPHIIEDPAVKDVDLVFAGHTHGGQVRLPLIGPLMGHNRLEYQLSAGLYTPAKLRRLYRLPNAPTLYVSRGLGTGLIHLRLFCRPEITTVTLRRE